MTLLTLTTAHNSTPPFDPLRGAVCVTQGPWLQSEWVVLGPKEDFLPVRQGGSSTVVLIGSSRLQRGEAQECKVIKRVPSDLERCEDFRLVYPDKRSNRGIHTYATGEVLSPEELGALEIRVAECMESFVLRQKRAAIAREVSQAKAVSQLERRKPEGAVAYILAEQDLADSDSQSDYFNHKTVRTVVLAFSRTGRADFRELRKAALKLAETQNLAALGAEVEHRENYSGGEGHYLKLGYAHASGWRVSKHTLVRLPPLDLAEDENWRV